ncbi:MAG: hypothetical protein ABSE62_08035 [Chthoniobacteraceae bacterium]|jgi:hypothetical protein
MRIKTAIGSLVSICLALCSCSKQGLEESQSTPAPAPVATPAPTPFPDQIYVVQASYGSGIDTLDVTEKVNQIFHTGKNIVPVSSDLAAVDPAPGQPKTLVVQFSGADGPFQLSAADGDSINIPAGTTVIRNPHLAPEGIYFLTKQVGVTTDSGITGLEPGTEVKVLKDGGATLHVTDGREEFDVGSDSITNNLDTARDACAQNAAALAAVAQWNSVREKEAEATEATSKWTPPPPPAHILSVSQLPAAAVNPLDQGAYDQHRAEPSSN